MLSFFSSGRRNNIPNASCNFASFRFFLLLPLFLLAFIGLQPDSASVSAAEGEAASEKISVTGLGAEAVGTDLEITIYCAAKPDSYFSVERLADPLKIAVDISNAEIAEPNRFMLPKDVGNIEVAIKDVTPDMVSIEFAFSGKYQWSSAERENDIVLTVENFYPEGAGDSPEEGEPEAEESPGMEPGAGDSGMSSPTESAGSPDAVRTGEESGAPASEQNPVAGRLPEIDPLQDSGAGNAADAGGSSDGGSGSRPLNAGESQLISVDFYKIDLHNVFRMLREITGKNIVVAEGVSGNLTLALDDVPWDFALDIILNLKDLKKMERGNTIVIYPKDQEFVWPEPDDLDIEEDVEITNNTAVVIEQEQNTPPEQLEAKKMIAQGRAAEKKGDLENALQFYEKALARWPENSKLANKISSIYLARLNQNAKAVFFAKKALAADKKNSSAALNAAVGYANMEEYRQAQQYFDQSVNIGEKPSREALISYAAFSERQRQYDAALRLLAKFEELYGQTLNSMIAQARILDAQGNNGAARKLYRAILHSGFRVPPDLRKFIMAKVGRGQGR
jgi:type IV pilus assembly protein PilQ